MENNMKVSMGWIILLILFVMLSKYNLYIGFSLKIYRAKLIQTPFMKLKDSHWQKQIHIF